MKLVVAVFRPERLAAVQRALEKRMIERMTVTNAVGSGHERGPSFIYRSATVEERLLSRLRLEVALDDDAVDSAVDAIRQTAWTGEVGDGVVWVLPLERVVRIRTGEEAICLVQSN
jgi:nitrogen regulatory protein P-II 1